MSKIGDGANPPTPDRRAERNADALARQVSESAGARGPAPVHLWNPPYGGDLDIRIARDGRWHYLGTPIHRERLVRLFASVLRKDEDGKHYLVTPVEKIGIRVDDAPFIGLDFRAAGDGEARRVIVVNNVGDETALGPDNPLWLTRDEETGEATPYYRVRGRLDARIDRKSFYRLVDISEMVARPDGDEFGFFSQGAFFKLSDAEELGEDWDPE